MQQLQMVVPPGATAGTELQFTTPDGHTATVTVPVGVPPGSSFVFSIPAAPPTQTAAPLPMGIPLGEIVDIPPQGLNMPPAAATRLAPAQRFAECPISFSPLHEAPVGYFLGHGQRRVSGHYFNLAAANAWLQSGNGLCPMTRQPISSVRPVPSVLVDPSGWFAVVDVDTDGQLSRVEAIEALKAQFPVDVAALDSALVDQRHWLWERWDVNGDGYLTRDELLAPQGLVHTVRELFAPQIARGTGGGGPPCGPPSISDKARWFDYWDSVATGGDGSGTLEREEVVRALIKTLGTSGDANAVLAMRGTVDAVWGVFDLDGSGSIDRNEFLARDGLADTIIATLAH